MLTGKLQLGSTSNKRKKDVKLFAIAGAMLLLLLGVLYWVFSSAPQDSETGNVVPTSINQPQVQASSSPVDQSILDESDNSGQPIPPPILQQDSIIDPEVEAAFRAQSVVSNFPTGVEEDQPIQMLVPPTSNVNSNLNAQNTLDIKGYLNDIKKDIVIEKGGLFYYQGKVYKKGDTLNTFQVVDIGDFYIRFAANNWEYSLRFLGDSK
ncbi:MAG: hypothetical protein LBJ88_04105 [Campylobacteraceae bacterium]|jgi:hypothetical protein|nr:hypothetical protein [Campylobacteraceae bacterium]